VTAQRIQEYLKARPEYVVTTSEFNDVKARLAMMHNRRKIDTKDLNRPQLRKAPGSGTTTDADGTDDYDDDRPTFETPSGRRQTLRATQTNFSLGAATGRGSGIRGLYILGIAADSPRSTQIRHFSDRRSSACNLRLSAIVAILLPVAIPLVLATTSRIRRSTPVSPPTPADRFDRR